MAGANQITLTMKANTDELEALMKDAQEKTEALKLALKKIGEYKLKVEVS